MLVHSTVKGRLSGTQLSVPWNIRGLRRWSRKVAKKSSQQLRHYFASWKIKVTLITLIFYKSVCTYKNKQIRTQQLNKSYVLFDKNEYNKNI